MRLLRTIGVVALLAMVVTTFVCASTASATTLEVEGEAKNEQVTITASLASGTSSQLTNTSGSIQNTCTTSHVHGDTESPYTGAVVTGPITSLSFSNCTRSVTVHKAGNLYVEHIAGTTKGTVYSEEAEVTVKAPLVEYLTCRTEGTHIGTLTGAGSGHATLHINAVLACGITAKWEATYTVTSPTGLGTVSEASPPSTMLEVEGEAKNEQVTITASLASGTSSQLTNTSGSIQNTCTTSHVHGDTESPYTGAVVTGPITSLSFSNCTRSVTVHKAGNLYVEHIAGTTNGTVYSEEAEVTVGAPLVGSLTCKTGTGTHIGTVTGAGSGHATLHINAVLACGITAKWEATYTVTSPTGLGTIDGGTTLEVEGEAKNEQVTITASLASGTSSQLTNTSGSIQNTCTTSHVHGNTESPYTGTRVTGPITSLSFTNCTRSVTVHKSGNLYVEHIAGSTNGTVYSEEAEVTVGAPLVKYLTCTTEGTHIGTLTGAGSGHATLHINAVLACGITAKWEATYTVTSPTGLGVSA